MNQPLVDTAKWYLSRPIILGLHAIRSRILELGEWLKQRNYLGFDVKVGNPIKEISTVYASSLMGWLNLYTLTSEDLYLQEAELCLERMLQEQPADGAWLFPYHFRNNQPDFPYACENFMTIRSLFYYLEHVGHKERVVVAIDKNLQYLRTRIGYNGGVFWYSAADKIKVPNISSMAANAFARASHVLGNPEYLELAKEFFDYCVDHQHPNGGYSYFEGEEMVYIPYHALEIWELQEANELLNRERAEESLRKASQYLTDYFAAHGYDSTSIKKKGQAPIILFKTPLWGAKAYLSRGNYMLALKHYKAALRLFSIPRQPSYFYLLKELEFRGRILQSPIWDSQFIRYNASCFEIGSRILLTAKESQ